MKIALKLISFSGLALTIIPPIIFFSGGILMDTMKLWMVIGMIAWMVSAPLWVNKKN
jgi:hypothetical protein